MKISRNPTWLVGGLMALTAIVTCKTPTPTSSHGDSANSNAQEQQTPAAPGTTTGELSLIGNPLTAVGPISPIHGYPMWYQDSTGVKAEFCVNGDPLCVALAAEPAFNPALPLRFPENFPTEGFYWYAVNNLTLSSGGQIRVLFAIEASTAVGTPMPGKRITFGRTLYVATGVADGLYRITQPYGVFDLDISLGRVRSVVDIGVGNETFTGVLNSDFGTLLRWDAGAAAGYLGNSAVAHTFVGSPYGTNFYRVEKIVGPNATEVAFSNTSTISCRLARNIVESSIASPSNTFPAGPSVTLVSDNPNANILYTLNGTSPTTSGLPYTAGSALAVTTGTLKTVWKDSTGAFGTVSTYTYPIVAGTLQATATPAAGMFTAPPPSGVTLAPAGGATAVWYTLDDSPPATSPTRQKYTSPILIPDNGTTLIRYIGVTTNAAGGLTAQSIEYKGYYSIAAQKLTRSGVNPAYELPFWVKDSAGQVVVPCVSPLVGPTVGVVDANCLAPAPPPGPGTVNSALQVLFPSNFSGETFMWTANAIVKNAAFSGGRASLVMGLEGAFASPAVVPGDRVLFGRIRFRVDVGTTGHYKVTHPYGVNYFDVTLANLGVKAINYSEDIAMIPNNFDAVLFGRIGPLLKWDPAVLPAAPVGYLGDPNVAHTVIGSPFNTNYFALDRQNADGTYTNMMKETGFVVAGKLGTVALDVGASPMGATYTSSRTVSLGASNTAAQIYYTTNGTVPSATNGTLYGSPFILAGVPGVNSIITLKYIATIPASTDPITKVVTPAQTSPVRTEIYTIVTPPIVTASPVGGVFADQVTVTLTGSRAGSIFYTTDGSDPLTSLSRKAYTAPIPFVGPAQATLRAGIIDAAGVASVVNTQVYVFTITLPTVTPPVATLVPGAQIAIASAATSVVSVPMNVAWTGKAFAGRTVTSYTLKQSLNGGVPAAVTLTPVTATTFAAKMNGGSTYQYNVQATDSGKNLSAVLTGSNYNVSVAQESAPSNAYSGPWPLAASAQYLGGLVKFSATRLATVTTTFTGSQVAWVTNKGTTMGIAAVSIDGGAPVNVDCYSPTTVNRAVAFTQSGLAAGVHTMKITVTGTKNVKALTTRVDMDAAIIVR